MTMTSVVLADVVPLVRIGLGVVLRGEALEIRGEVATGADLMKAVLDHAPDLVLIGAVNDLSIEDLVRQIRDAAPETRIAGLARRVPRESLADLLAVGLDGLLARAGEPADLVLGITRVLAGERYLDPALIAGEVPDDEFAASALTARERDVLGLLATGCSNREIASNLFVSLPTVKTHLAHIYEKLDARNRNEALGRAMALGLLT
jgi:DNA-binding NarL/FixJ family response regulator